jgi:hypothetical protein
MPPCEIIDWSTVPNRHVPGASGDSFWRTAQFADMRLRIVEYPVGYLADHWCELPHVIHLLAGAITIELASGETFGLNAGQTCRLAAGVPGHRVHTIGDATAVAWIIDHLS